MGACRAPAPRAYQLIGMNVPRRRRWAGLAAEKRGLGSAALSSAQGAYAGEAGGAYAGEAGPELSSEAKWRPQAGWGRGLANYFVPTF